MTHEQVKNCPINPELVEHKMDDLKKDFDKLENSFESFKEEIFKKLDDLHKEHNQDHIELLKNFYSKKEVDQKLQKKASRWVEHGGKIVVGTVITTIISIGLYQLIN